MGDLGIRVQETHFRFELRRQPQVALPSRRTPCLAVKRPATSVNVPVQRHCPPALLSLSFRAVQVSEQMQGLVVAEPGPVDGFLQALIKNAMECFEIGLTDGKGIKERLRKRLHQLSRNGAPRPVEQAQQDTQRSTAFGTAMNQLRVFSADFCGAPGKEHTRGQANTGVFRNVRCEPVEEAYSMSRLGEPFCLKHRSGQCLGCG